MTKVQSVLKQTRENMQDPSLQFINPNKIKWRDGSCLLFVKKKLFWEIVGMATIPHWLRSAVNNLQLCLYKCGVAFLPHEHCINHGLKRLLSGLF